MQLNNFCIYFSFLILFSCNQNKTQTTELNKKTENSQITPVEPEAEKSDSVQISAPVVKDGAVSLKEYKFDEELCSVKALYNSTKYTKEQLDGAYKLAREMFNYSLDKPSVFNEIDLQDILENRDKYLKSLDEQYPKIKKNIESIAVPNEKFWLDLKQKYLKQLDDEYEFETTQIKAFSDVSLLKNSRFSTGKCKKYSDALNADDETLIAVWGEFAQQQSINNADPQRIIDDFKRESEAYNFRDYAKIELITFAWGNCANSSFRKIRHDEKLNTAFEKLFTKFERYDCSEP